MSRSYDENAAADEATTELALPTEGTSTTETTEGASAETTEDTSPLWRERIVGFGYVYPEDLLANPLNFRIHPRSQQEALTGVLSTIGNVASIMVNVNSQFVVDGHLRATLGIMENDKLEAKGEPKRKLRVEYVDLSEDEERLILATFDPISAAAGTDSDILNELLSLVDTTHAGLMQFLSDTYETEIADKQLEAPPTIKELAEKEGDDYEPTGYWPTIRIMCPAPVESAWNSLLKSEKEANDGEEVKDYIVMARLLGVEEETLAETAHLSAESDRGEDADGGADVGLALGGLDRFLHGLDDDDDDDAPTSDRGVASSHTDTTISDGDSAESAESEE